MDKHKKIERIEKKNERLLKQLDYYKSALLTEREDKEQNEIKIEDLLNELDYFYQELNNVMEELQAYKQEYSDLIRELYKLRADFELEGLRPPFYIRILDKLKRRW